LPIVTSSAPGTDEILTRYGAGEIVRSQSTAEFAAALVRVLRDSTRMREGARRFVDEHQWSLALQPLADFVRAPHFDSQKEAFAAAMQVPERSRSFFTRIKRRIGGSS
jgi:glycosyltransferase involved in cell wall biosynthesis